MSDNSLDRIDRSRLEEIGMGDAEFTRELIEMMIRDGEERVAAIRAAYDGAQWEAAGKAAHSLKGAALNIGANPLAQLCARIDDAARKSKTLVDEGTIQSVEQEFEWVRQELEMISAELRV